MSDRTDVYQRKIHVVAEELGSLPESVDSLNLLERKGVLHAVQVAIDAALDLAAMAVKDRGREVSDEYHNPDILAEEGVIDGVLVAQMKRLNGLRNAIVHKYNRFEEEVLSESLQEVRETLFAYARRLERVP